MVYNFFLQQTSLMVTVDIDTIIHYVVYSIYAVDSCNFVFRKTTEYSRWIVYCIQTYYQTLQILCVRRVETMNIRRGGREIRLLTMPLFLLSKAVTSTTTAVLIPMFPLETPATILARTNRAKL